jgi:hypothetical protein
MNPAEPSRMRLKLRLARRAYSRGSRSGWCSKRRSPCESWVGSLGGQSCRARDAAGRSGRALITHAGNLKINPVAAAKARCVIDDVLAEQGQSR